MNKRLENLIVKAKNSQKEFVDYWKDIVGSSNVFAEGAADAKDGFESNLSCVSVFLPESLYKDIPEFQDNLNKLFSSIPDIDMNVKEKKGGLDLFFFLPLDIASINDEPIIEDWTRELINFLRDNGFSVPYPKAIEDLYKYQLNHYKEVFPDLF